MRRLILASAVFTAFLLGYGVIANAWPYMGRNNHYGYFQNDHDTDGSRVWQPNVGPDDCEGTGYAVPTGINSKSEFIAFVKCKLTQGNTQERTGARFIIQVMRGGTDHSSPSSSDITDWENRINNPDVTVDWGSSTYRSYTINSFYQATGSGINTVDDAFYADSDSSNQVIRFLYSGSVTMMVRRECANPVGELPGLPANPAFNISGDSNVEAPGIPPGKNIQVPPGTLLTWRHVLTSNAATSPQTIDWTTHNQSGTQYTSGGFGTMAAGVPETHVYTFTAPATVGSVHCRYIRWTPDTQLGGTQQSTQACATVTGNYDLEPTVNAAISSGGTIAEPGDTITFSYGVINGGTTPSPSASCTYRSGTNSGHDETAPTTVFVPSGATTCPPDQVFPVGTTSTATEVNVPAATANTTICRSLTITPAAANGSSATTQTCILVAAKPYARAYGGDISAGGGLATSPETDNSCGLDANAAIIGWNRRSSTWAAAGAQFAAYAMSTIFDTATSLGNASGSAAAPTGLSFANGATDAAAGNFGGNFGSVACIADYYARLPAGATATSGGSGAISAMTSGSYTASGDTTFSAAANIDPGERITVYVDGNVYLNGNVTYTGSWSTSNLPSFQLVVRGNIYIDRGVSRLDGLYVAQVEGATGGEIYTCANTTLLYGAIAPTDLASQCGTKLTINGSLVGKQIRLMRTAGTQGLATETETAAGGNMAEAFNYGPALWIPQSTGDGANPGYDSIISLPPVL